MDEIPSKKSLKGSQNWSTLDWQKYLESAVDHEHAVAKVAVEALQHLVADLWHGVDPLDEKMTDSGPNATRVLRQIAKSGWNPRLQKIDGH